MALFTCGRLEVLVKKFMATFYTYIWTLRRSLICQNCQTVLRGCRQGKEVFVILTFPPSFDFSFLQIDLHLRYLLCPAEPARQASRLKMRKGTFSSGN